MGARLTLPGVVGQAIRRLFDLVAGLTTRVERLERVDYTPSAPVPTGNLWDGRVEYRAHVSGAALVSGTVVATGVYRCHRVHGWANDGTYDWAAPSDDGTDQVAAYVTSTGDLTVVATGTFVGNPYALSFDYTRLP